MQKAGFLTTRLISDNKEIALFLSKQQCYGCSLKSSRDTLYEHPQYMFLWATDNLFNLYPQFSNGVCESMQPKTTVRYIGILLHVFLKATQGE